MKMKLWNTMGYHLAEITKSSIFKIIRTVSVASDKALSVTSVGYIILYFLSSISFTTLPPLTLIPANLWPRACLFLSSVTTVTGSKPAFSDRVNGTISKASAKALTQFYSAPLRVLAYWASFWASSTSMAPPPGMIPLFLTRHLTTQRASWRDLSVSSIT